MKIIFDIWIASLQKAGGISRYWSGLLNSLAEQDVDYDVFGELINENLFLSNKLWEQNAANIHLSHSLYKRFLKVNIPNHTKYDIFHTSYLYRPRHSNLKYCTTVHDLMYFKHDHRWQSKIYRTQFKNAIRQSNAIICISEATKYDLLHYFPDIEGKKINVIHNGVDDIFYDNTHKKNSLLQSINLSKKYILYVGSRGECKNFDFVIKVSQSAYFKDNNINLLCVSSLI